MPTFIQELTGSGIKQLQDLLKQGECSRTPTDAKNDFKVCQAIFQGIELSWRNINQLLDEGTEGRGLRFLLLEIRDVIKVAAFGLPKIREKIENESPAFPGKEAGLLALAESIDRVEKIHQELESLIAWLPDAPPQVDPASITSAGAVEKAEGYVSLEELLARARSGDQ